MGRIYAGILGALAMTIVLCRGVKDASGTENTLTMAIIALVVYAIIGSVLGQIAQATVDESVQQRIELQLAPRPTHTTGSHGAST